MNAIEIRDLTKDFGQGRGIFDLDLDVPKGTVHGFVGPNGSGKTTTIRVLLDLLRRDSGEVRLLGQDAGDEPHELRRKIGYLPGELALPEALTGREYLAHSAALRGGIDEEAQADLVSRLNVQLDPKIRTLSKGNKQKIALIDALQHQPQLLILDEPTDGLDPLLRNEIHDLLRSHAEAGGTVFLSSHVVHEIQTTCDDVSIILSGKLRAQAKVSDLIADEGMVVEALVEDVNRAADILHAAGVPHVMFQGKRIRFRVQGNPLPSLAALHGLGATEPHIKQGDLEEKFLRIYEEDRA